MSHFDARIYWPQPKQGHTITNYFSSRIIQTYTRDYYDGFRLRQRIKLKWDCDWYYRIDPIRGVLEYRDDYPPKWYNWPWQYAREVSCVPGKEIEWGGNEQTGTTIVRQCETSGLFGQYGSQVIIFHEIIPFYETKAGTFMEVLVLTYGQQWGGGRIDGAKMWFAPGLGQIRAEWRRNGAPTGYFMELLETRGMVA